jgi:hypothetical protein
MNTSLRSIAFVALMSVCGVQHVSGFTQTDTNRDLDKPHSSQDAVRVYIAANSATFDSVERAPNLTIAPIYHTLVDAMLSRSSTFRRQCARIAAAPHLSVLIRSDPPVGTHSAAVTSIQQRSNGRVQAIVQIAPSARTVELIAHEIEHIIEQLDGIDLRFKSRLRSSGVRRTWDFDAYETTRAIVTGQRVAREAGRTP